MSRLEFECHPDGLFMVFLDATSVIVTCIECETSYSWKRCEPGAHRITAWQRLRSRWKAWRILLDEDLDGNWPDRLKASQGDRDTGEI